MICIINDISGFGYEIKIGKKVYENPTPATDWYYLVRDVDNGTVVKLVLWGGRREILIPDIHLDKIQSTKLSDCLYIIDSALRLGAKGKIIINPGDSLVGEILSKFSKAHFQQLFSYYKRLQEIVYIGGHTVVEKLSWLENIRRQSYSTRE